MDSNIEKEITAHLGDEFDDRLRAAVVLLIKELRGKTISKSWGVGGSQEVETWKVEIFGKPTVFKAETYIGLSVSGPASLVEAITTRLNPKQL